MGVNPANGWYIPAMRNLLAMTADTVACRAADLQASAVACYTCGIPFQCRPPHARRDGQKRASCTGEVPVKQGIHPEYVTAAVKCACGTKFETRATKPNINVEICSACHPFYTGRQKFVDSEGRVERFQKKYARQKKQNA